MKKILLALILLTTPAIAQDKGRDDLENLLACNDPYDAAHLYTLLRQDDDKVTVAWFEPKQKAGLCGALPKARYFIMKQFHTQGRAYSCVRPEGQQYCMWTMEVSGL